MTKTIENLLKNSRLPGPRGNLELMFSFAQNASVSEINECLAYNREDLHNCPEEFVMMCGIVGYCVLNRNGISDVIENIRKYASHQSWRIREAVAIGIQQIAGNNMEEVIDCLENWMNGNELEKRAVAAALCEPKLLREKHIVVRVLEILNRITRGFEKIHSKLSGDQNSLRKTLGYAWSVAIVSLPEEGKAVFEKIAAGENKNIQWIIKENLKKNRMIKMDKNWVEELRNLIS